MWKRFIRWKSHKWPLSINSASINVRQEINFVIIPWDEVPCTSMPCSSDSKPDYRRARISKPTVVWHVMSAIGYTCDLTTEYNGARLCSFFDVLKQYYECKHHEE